MADRMVTSHYTETYRTLYDDPVPLPELEPLSTASWRIEVRDADLAVIGQVDAWTSLKVMLRHRRAGAWSLVIPASHPQASLFAEGRGIIAWAPWSVTEPLMSGPLYRMTMTAPETTNPATLTVDGIDDTALLGDRIVLPDPTSDPDDQDEATYWTQTDTAEGLIRAVVDVNAGDGALSNRRMCDATTTTTDVGTELSVQARFDNLLTLIDEIATTDNLTVRLVQPSGVADRVLEVEESTDRSASVRLSQEAGTVVSATAALTAPSATSVLVAGGGEGTDRVLVERVNSTISAEWNRRVEVFRDARDTTDLTELQKRGDESLLDGAATSGINVVPIDLPFQKFGVHYGLGDTVTVEVSDLSYTDVITAVEISADAESGTVVTPSVGNAEAADTKSPAIYARVRELTKRLEALERRQ